MFYPDLRSRERDHLAIHLAISCAQCCGAEKFRRHDVTAQAVFAKRGGTALLAPRLTSSATMDGGPSCQTMTIATRKIRSGEMLPMTRMSAAAPRHGAGSRPRCSWPLS